METFQILSDQFSHFQHLFHRWLAIFFIISSYIFDLSSSPHMWGILGLCLQAAHIVRFIPTYVGHTRPFLRWGCDHSVHPHIRGAYPNISNVNGSQSGSSPHTWGIRYLPMREGQALRFIPTYVGHTFLPPPPHTPPPVHPHIRGAYNTP